MIEVPLVPKDRAHGFYPIEDSIQAYGIKLEFDKNEPGIHVVHNFRLAVGVAIAREDDACDRRSGGLGLIFLFSMVENTSLPIARAGAAVYFDALTQYCKTKKIDPKTLLFNNGTPEKIADNLLDYASSMRNLIVKAIEAQAA
ncbi:MAG: hypothetical protein U9Q63_03325 [Patescibacteria group bacterium]|nr:hypothetical protein [Patescibacteria group bacterium]